MNKEIEDEDRRWVVEIPGVEFHDVGAERLEVSGGCLVFYGTDGLVSIVYAPGTWTGVSR